MASTLIDTAEALLASEDALDLETVLALASQIRQTPPTDPEQRDALLAVMARLAARTRDELTLVGAALRQNRRGRRALDGYGHLKSSKQAQHTRKLA